MSYLSAKTQRKGKTCKAVRTGEKYNKKMKQTFLILAVFCALASANAQSKTLQVQAKKGDAQAQYEFGNFYEHANEGKKAVVWYRKAAEQENAKAQERLGFNYEKGWGGLPQDYVQAVYWYRKTGGASSQLRLKELGDEQAKEYMDEYYKELERKKQVEAAQKAEENKKAAETRVQQEEVQQTQPQQKNRVQCYICKGTGTVACGAFDCVRGRTVDIHSGADFGKCGQCNGLGYKSCSSCGGKGYIEY